MLNEKLVAIIAEQFGVSPDDIEAETRFVEDLGADSLDAVELLMDIEEKFDITISDGAIDTIVTVGQADQLVTRLNEVFNGQCD